MGNILCPKPKRRVTIPGQQAVLTRMIIGSTKFAFKIYSELSKESERNLFFSPTNISMTLALLYLCAKEETASEIRKTSQLTDMDEDEIHSGAKQLSVFLTTEREGSTVINTSHRLFVKKEKKLRKAIIKATESYFGSSPQIVDFASGLEMSRREVNRTVESDTEGKVRDFLAEENNPITHKSSVMSTGAFYFKGKWKKEFDAENTEVAKFKIKEGFEIDVEMMYNLLETGYATSSELDCQVVDVPYVKGDMSMFVILPNREDGLAELEDKITAEKLEALIRQTYTRKENMLFKLPKFSLENQFSMNGVLRSLGINRIFSETEADLSKINKSKNLCLSEIQHKTIFEVDEEGKPFVPPGDGQMGECSPTEFLKILRITADHPFLFAVQDNRTYAIHVMGRIVNPKTNM